MVNINFQCGSPILELSGSPLRIIHFFMVCKPIASRVMAPYVYILQSTCVSLLKVGTGPLFRPMTKAPRFSNPGLQSWSPVHGAKVMKIGLAGWALGCSIDIWYLNICILIHMYIHIFKYIHVHILINRSGPASRLNIYDLFMLEFNRNPRWGGSKPVKTHQFPQNLGGECP